MNHRTYSTVFSCCKTTSVGVSTMMNLPAFGRLTSVFAAVFGSSKTICSGAPKGPYLNLHLKNAFLSAGLSKSYKMNRQSSGSFYLCLSPYPTLDLSRTMHANHVAGPSVVFALASGLKVLSRPPQRGHRHYFSTIQKCKNGR